jgi:hypothetical protein
VGCKKRTGRGAIPSILSRIGRLGLLVQFLIQGLSGVRFVPVPVLAQWLIEERPAPLRRFDLMEVKHTVEVSAGSVYEAVAQALQIFRDNEWVKDLGRSTRQRPLWR